MHDRTYFPDFLHERHIREELLLVFDYAINQTAFKRTYRSSIALLKAFRARLTKSLGFVATREALAIKHSPTSRRYGRSAIRMLFCKISEHILDEIHPGKFKS